MRHALAHVCGELSYVYVCYCRMARPRPDFYYRCFPTELLEVDETALHCTGNTVDVEQGLKSFPSGHTGCE